MISVARNQKLNENESKEPQETTYVSAGDMLTAPWPCQVSTAPSTPRASSTRAVALAFHGQLPTPSSTLCHTVPRCLTELGICSTSCHVHRSMLPTGRRLTVSWQYKSSFLEDELFNLARNYRVKTKECRLNCTGCLQNQE